MKEFKTIDEQIQILLGRKLIINDIDKAKAYLLSQNYYNIINGYANFSHMITMIITQLKLTLMKLLNYIGSKRSLSKNY